MLSLTTWQRDLLQHLINTGEPLDTTAYGQQLHLSLRQVRYGLREIESWLTRRQVLLVNTPRIGLQVICTPEQRQRLLAELSSQTKFQLILTPEQRQQLLALLLLVACEPLTLQQLQQDLVISRMTALKDLEAIEPWLHNFYLQVARRTHRGCWIEGDELARRQALAALLWGDTQSDQPVMSVHTMGGIRFTLAQDSALLPVVAQVNTQLHRWDLTSAQQHIANAETELGVRFTDEAITLMTLAVAIQLQRVRAGQQVAWKPEALRWIQAQVVWPVVTKLGTWIWPQLPETTRTAETAALALQLLCGARDVPWSDKFGMDNTFHKLINKLMETIATAYGVPELATDSMLYDGLDVLIMPAYVRQRFNLWAPHRSTNDTSYLERYPIEHTVAAQIADQVVVATGVPLQPAALDDLVLLLRAAIIRAQPERTRHILVVCPSGMATTQLLVARLKARFFHMGTFEVLPMRELSAERIANADLLITTVPLTLPDEPPIDVIQVHPLLKSEDIAALTQWLA
jgi:mannitol operon transcriptional antiterminator